MRFVTLESGESIRLKPKNTIMLHKDLWDDYSHEIQYNVSYFDDIGTEHAIGDVKILQRSQDDTSSIKRITKLSREFKELDERHISIGQGEDYYKNLRRKLGADEAGDVLTALRDIAWRSELANDFEPTSAFRNALMRHNAAQRGRRFGRSIILGEQVQEHFHFQYQATIPGATEPVDLDFSFDGKDKVPGRIVALIGRNAVGKTRVLASLAQDLAQIERSSVKRLKNRDERFVNGRPLFARVLAISYSTFDKFARPKSEATSYGYCGIRSEKGALSTLHLEKVYRENQKRVRDADRSNEWISHVHDILGEQSKVLKAKLRAEINSAEAMDDQLSLLSSGQAILTHFVTALLAWIQPNSLVLFDEPETHLHPNAVSTLFGVLSDILKQYDSYAVLATHSPIVIQEVPAERVLVLRREGNVTTAEPLGLESFGESISELTRHVFETHDAETQYRQVLKQLAHREDAEDVMGRFPMGLGLSAQAYLLGQYGSKGKIR